MAIRPDNKPLRIGSVQSVEIEAVHDEVLMVCLKRNGKVFRGALINSPPGGCPVGLPSTPALCEKLNKEFPMPNGEPVVVVEPEPNTANDASEKLQHSALSYRQAYFQNMPLPPPKPLLHSRKEEFREKGPRSQTVPTRSRHIRLRPRQVLCTRCQAKCGQSTSTSSKNSSKNGISDKSRTLLAKKRKLLADANSNVPRKKIKKEVNGNGKQKIQQQRSPIIKISYATPQGKGQVMRIDRTQNNKTVAASHKSSTQNGGKPTLNGQKNMKKAQKVLKIAKTKAQQKVVKGKPMKVAMFNRFHPKSPSGENGKMKKIRIIKSSKGTYHSTTSTSSGSNNTPKNGVNKKTIGNLTIVTTKLSTSSLSNGPSSKPNNKKQTNGKNNNSKTDGAKVNGLALPPHIPVKNSGYDSSSECSNQSSKSSRSTKSSKSAKRGNGTSQSSGEDSDNPIIAETSVQVTNQASLKVPPLNLRIHKKNVTKSSLPDGRVLCIGDVVWGKIIGFPWWPGRINEISISRRDNGIVLEQEAQITWFAATTLSYMPLSKLYPFLKYFSSRYDRKKRGVYKEAVRQATEAASSMSPEVRALNTMFETSQLQP